MNLNGIIIQVQRLQNSLCLYFGFPMSFVKSLHVGLETNISILRMSDFRS